MTEYPHPGENRISTSFDVSVRLPYPASFNLLFKDKDRGEEQEEGEGEKGEEVEEGGKRRGGKRGVGKRK